MESTFLSTSPHQHIVHLAAWLGYGRSTLEKIRLKIVDNSIFTINYYSMYFVI